MESHTVVRRLMRRESAGYVGRWCGRWDGLITAIIQGSVEAVKGSSDSSGFGLMGEILMVFEQLLLQ